MRKPTSKNELSEWSQLNYKKLLELVDSYSEEDVENEFPEGTMNRNIKDVFAHLHQWHLFMLTWYKRGMSGKEVYMPAEGFTWKTIPQLNAKIREDYKKTSFSEAKLLLDDSYHQVQKIIEHHSNEELFEKQRYKWTGTTSLGAYLISNTSSHYQWAFKLIKKSMKK